MDARISAHARHQVHFTRGVFEPGNPLLGNLLADVEAGARAAVFVDSGVAEAFPALPEAAISRLRAREPFAEIPIPIEVVPGGEACKNDRRILDRVLDVIHSAKLCRRSFAMVIGGGAVLDVVGFAASLAHRGVRCLRVASTTLAQADSAIGVKNGVNAYGVKNYLGSFAVPWAVVCDVELLATLPQRDWRAGFAEAVKVAILKDEGAFREIELAAAAIDARQMNVAEPVLRRSAQLHFDHIAGGGDPFELSRARPLDFGHWSAHRLEELTHFEMRHGEAVAIGVALDSVYAAEVGLLALAGAERICGCFEELGFELAHPLLDRPDVLLAGLEAFREHLGGRLTLTLPRAIGSTTDVHEFDPAAFRRAALKVKLRGPVRAGR